MSEQDLVNSILAYLALLHAYALRINSGAIPVDNLNGSKRMVRLAPPGTPDIIGCYQGHFFAIEAKIGDNKPTALQAATLAQIREAGGQAIVAWDLQDVIDAFEKEIICQ